jgi:autotransporter-associated beta strand protein
MISNLQRDPNLAEDRLIPASLAFFRAPAILPGRARFIVLTFICLCCDHSLLMGATSTWTGDSNVNQLWSNGANWGGVAPTSTTTTDLIFAGTTNVGTLGSPLNNNIATPFVLNSMTFNAGGGAFFLGGNSLQFNGATDLITQSSSNAISIANSITATGKSGNSSETITLTGNGSGVVTLSGTILVGNGNRDYAITKTGTSTFVLSGNNTYGGATTVNAGTLLINGNQASATGTVTVNNSGTLLGGTGTIGGAVTINGPGRITAATNGTTGTLTLSNGLTLSGTSGNLATYLVDLTASASDKLAITGNLNLSTLFDQISFQGTIGAASYQLITYTGTLTGTFDTVTNLPSGYTLQYNTGEIDLVAVPEPSTSVAAAVALGAIGFTQRRKLIAALAKASIKA